jgi:16S rRNA (adenine1518-N6/adenine1519-N6)-dimethyltransferase
VDGAFGERRKTMANALRRLGLGRDDARAALREAGVDPSERPERLGLAEFARIAQALLAGGWRP